MQRTWGFVSYDFAGHEGHERGCMPAKAPANSISRMPTEIVSIVVPTKGTTTYSITDTESDAVFQSTCPRRARQQFCTINIHNNPTLPPIPIPYLMIPALIFSSTWRQHSKKAVRTSLPNPVHWRFALKRIHRISGSSTLMPRSTPKCSTLLPALSPSR